VLLGGLNDDILIGGRTTYDNNVPALQALMAEWKLGASYGSRREHLLGQPGGLNGTYSLIGTVIDDGPAVDTLTGGDGADWFWGTALEFQDKQPWEKVGTQL
jgi:hypothetical protein